MILDAQMFLPQVAEDERTDPGQNQLASDCGDSSIVLGGSSAKFPEIGKLYVNYRMGAFAFQRGWFCTLVPAHDFQKIGKLYILYFQGAFNIFLNNNI